MKGLEAASVVGGAAEHCTVVFISVIFFFRFWSTMCQEVCVHVNTSEYTNYIATTVIGVNFGDMSCVDCF